MAYEHAQTEIQFLKQRIQELERENDSIKLSADKNSIKFTKFLQKNKEYLNTIDDLLCEMIKNNGIY